MTKDRDNVRIYGGDASGVWKAPKGTTAPTTLATPTTPHVELGWLSEDGVEFGQEVDKTEHFAHQGGALMRVTYGKAKRSFKFQCLEETATVLGLVHPGIAFTKTGTGASEVAKGTIPAGISPVEEAWVIDEVDDSSGAATDIVKRWCGTGTVDPSMTVAHKFEELTVYEFTVNMVGPVELLTNSPGVLDEAVSA